MHAVERVGQKSHNREESPRTFHSHSTVFEDCPSFIIGRYAERGVGRRGSEGGKSVDKRDCMTLSESANETIS